MTEPDVRDAGGSDAFDEKRLRPRTFVLIKLQPMLMVHPSCFDASSRERQTVLKVRQITPQARERSLAFLRSSSYKIHHEQAATSSGSTPLECKTRRLAVRDNEPFKVSQRGARPVVSQPSPYADAEPL
uniref:Uncharacterized protein n=1 Tax=Anopheles melas TaxID=34690 RepID=A0A182UHI6_9DIPT